ncbi:YceD family protein [Oceanotoga teriensis]|uniref:YceD family protein n=1 Tax=Oceanotoga teriensis TaxID=515440 RepID=UPI002712B6B3|nr:DUF177 domain-containing protein [Oceanotoga teriensis]MDO7975606.1 DUF177 domain-containing protein [Oceanotoga teriensis]
MLNENLSDKNLIINTERFEKKIEKSVIINDWKTIQLLNEESEILSPIKVDFKVEKVSNGFIANGRINTELKLSCSRCLNEFNYNIESDFEAYYISKDFEKSLSKIEHLNSLDNTIYYDGINIDLTERIIEAIILKVPELPLCKEDCKGLCPNCGIDLNENPNHNCEEEYVDPRFASLLNLLKEDKDSK